MRICFSDFLGFFFSFFVRASKMSYFTAFAREIDAFYASPSTSPASFSTSPACPTNIPSITNKSCVSKVAGGGSAPSHDVRGSDDSTRGAIKSL